ncbi:MAG TPA: 50S ribosomal protein L17 [Candidatus Saccharimonadales bacterium]|nr:50S ribosomal protein L17 [Candidatus Saccharimonadales bacterium]
MRHRYAGKYLNRTTAHRMAMMKNLASSLIDNGVIETTEAKAKFVKPYIEKLITKAKNSTGFTTVKYLKTKLATEDSVRNLLEKVAPMYKERHGGYTKITKLRNRVGDNAFMAKIEFIKEALPEKKAKAVKVSKSKKEAVKIVNEVKDDE